MQFNVHDAKTNLSDLILRAEAGEEVVIARRGKPAVKLVPVSEGRKRAFGKFAALSVQGDVTGPLEGAELDAWE